MTTGELLRRIDEQAAAAVAPLGLLVEDVALTPAGRRRIVRIALDRDLSELDTDDETSRVPPLSLDDIADATRAVDAALDRSDILGEQPYVLEVSSPGVGRPLREPRHFRRNVGRLVELAGADGVALTGRVVRAGSDGFTVDLQGTGLREVAYADVVRASVQVEFGRDEDEEG